MDQKLPAYSSQFAPETLPALLPTMPLGGITADWAWGGATGAGIRVAVIDSGIDASHEAIGGRVSRFVQVREEPEGLVCETEPHGDSCGHGTACASIIRALAPDCELYSVKVLGPGGSGRAAVFAAGLRWAIENGAHVCNLSLGTTKRDHYAVFHELADLAYFRNVALVAAANNMPQPSFPSVYASVISVASHDIDDPHLFYANPNPPVEYGAHGVNVHVAWPGGGWKTVTGNSFAAPHVSGLVASLLSKHPGLTVSQVKVILWALAANMKH